MKNEDLIKTLYDCVAHCNNCADACLDEENVKMMIGCIRLDRICAATCTATAEALSVKTKADITGMLKACADICEKCSNECAKHEAQHCKDCAEACKRCAEACRNFAA
ncbi:MAG TPA: four-helix bundle copper-binding protein [Salinimicrobium sp.]|nr:four-helix bundle copper-binding protein [Salinimicrobium sp.]